MSEIKFNVGSNYGFYQKDDSKPAAKEEAAKEAPVAPETKSVSADKVLDAMSFIGAQNIVHVNGKMPVNPTDFLSDDRIASIEDSMAEFEKGVEKYQKAIEAEFGSIFSEDTVLALAANAFALQ